MDFIIGLPKVFGKYCIFVVVDRLTKFAHVFSITTTFTAAQVAELFSKEFFILHGIPKSIVSDRDSIFFSAFWQEIFKMVGKNLRPSTIYNPQIDGKIERVTKWLEGLLVTVLVGSKKHG